MSWKNRVLILLTPILLLSCIGQIYSRVSIDQNRSVKNKNLLSGQIAGMPFKATRSDFTWDKATTNMIMITGVNEKSDKRNDQLTLIINNPKIGENDSCTLSNIRFYKSGSDSSSLYFISNGKVILKDLGGSRVAGSFILKADTCLLGCDSLSGLSIFGEFSISTSN